MRFGLVLGAGGVVGMAYHAGVLHALEVEAGLDAAGADLIVGTSAGSAVGAHLRIGWTPRDFWEMALGSHESLADLSPEEQARRQQALWARAWESPTELARRTLGSAFVLARTVMRAPRLRVPETLRRQFPGGFYRMESAEERLAEQLPEAWPERPLWLCAVDLGTGRRVVLGRQGSPEATLVQGVLASCAIPGVYQPVRIGRRVLIDGGVHSTTNLDLAAKAGCDLIIGVAPMAFDPADAPDPGRQLVRRIPSRALSREVSFARGVGAEVLLIRPTATELRHHGNPMRQDASEQVARAAYEATARFLDTPRFRRVLAELAA